MFHQLKETIHVELNGELKRNLLKAMTTLVFELPYRKNSLEYNQLILRVLFFFIHLFKLIRLDQELISTSLQLP